MTKCELMAKIIDNLNEDFIYVTLARNSIGEHFRYCSNISSQFNEDWNHRIFQLLASANDGHVPIPLSVDMEFGHGADVAKAWKRSKANASITGFHFNRWGNWHAGRNNEHLIGWSGNMWDIRTMLHMEFQQYVEQELIANNITNDIYTRYRGELFSLFGSDCCKFMLTPRGVAPSTYSIYETLSMHGSVPIYLWNSIEWLPYKSIADKFLISIEWQKYCNDTLFDIIGTAQKTVANEAKYRAMLDWAEQNYDDYFSMRGLKMQIEALLMQGPANHNGSMSKLECEGPTSHTNEGHGGCLSFRNDHYPDKIINISTYNDAKKQ